MVFKDEYGTEHKAFLSKNVKSEVIVSCGAIGSPQLLMLSGIGPRDELKKFNITPVLVNENVGMNMVDNPMNTVFVPFKKHVDQSLIEIVGITKKGVYIEASNGFSQNSSTIHCHHGIMSAEVSIIFPQNVTISNHNFDCTYSEFEMVTDWPAIGGPSSTEDRRGYQVLREEQEGLALRGIHGRLYFRENRKPSFKRLPKTQDN